jgi:hypothetical protein
MSRTDKGGSALHEAVSNKQDHVVEFLLRRGSDPFTENAKKLTAMDLACLTKNVSVLRQIETNAPFKGWLLMKVLRFGGMGAEWQRRWCIIYHRYPFPDARTATHVTHVALVAYKRIDSAVPVCKVWLDGARAVSMGASLNRSAMTGWCANWSCKFMQLLDVCCYAHHNSEEYILKTRGRGAADIPPFLPCPACCRKRSSIRVRHSACSRTMALPRLWCSCIANVQHPQVCSLPTMTTGATPFISGQMMAHRLL